MKTLLDPPNEKLLYLVGIFSIEPAHETRALRGQLGELTPAGDLEWHVEVIQARREIGDRSRGAALAVVYLRVDEHEWPNVPRQENIDQAYRLIHRLLAPKEWSAGRPLEVRVIDVAMYRASGKALGGSVYENTTWNIGAGDLGADYDTLHEHPELELAIRYYTRGVAAAHQRFLPDACINYARCLESLVGSTSHKPQLRAECKRLGLDAAAMIEFLERTRSKYAIGHALDRVKNGVRKPKEPPTHEIEMAARQLCKAAIESYHGAVSASRRAPRRHSYFGPPPIALNLPLPLEVLWAHSGPWAQAAPGLQPDIISASEACARFGISRARLSRLAESGLVRTWKAKRRTDVGAIQLEFLMKMRGSQAETSRSRRRLPIDRAAETSGIAESDLRAYVRDRTLRGRLREKYWGPWVDSDDLLHLVWLSRRRGVVEKLGLPKRLDADVPRARARKTYKRRAHKCRST